MPDEQIELMTYFGKYRGTVVQNVDPLQIGRIQVRVPDVSSLAPSPWAMPCLPVAGMQMGLYAVPLLGASVWVEYEQGDPDRPIWVGGFWETVADVPALSHLTPPPIAAITLQTPLQNALIISDMPGPTGGILLKSTSGASIIVNDTGIYIQNGRGSTITMVGPTVDVNQGALTVI